MLGRVDVREIHIYIYIYIYIDFRPRKLVRKIGIYKLITTAGKFSQEQADVKTWIWAAEQRTGESGVEAPSQDPARRKLTAKDVWVEKLVEKGFVSDFRQWEQCVELQLSNCHGHTAIEEVILTLRRFRKPITESVCSGILGQLY